MKRFLLSTALLIGCGAEPPIADEPTAGFAASCAIPRDVAPLEGEQNVLGGALVTCSAELLTGFHRNGFCTTGPDDLGVHVVCAQVTEAFLRFTASEGNDLSTPRGAFPGLIPGNRWCVCASRWQDAYEAGVAPPVVLEATSRAAVRDIPSERLAAHAESSAP